jgi:hypothetical protein
MYVGSSFSASSTIAARSSSRTLLGTRAIDICRRRYLQSGMNSGLGFLRSPFRYFRGVAMSRVTIRVSGAVILYGSLAATMPARGEDRSADAILKEIVAITLPEADLSRVADKLYLREFMKQRSEIRVRRAELIGALYRADPDNPRLVTLLPVRWRSLSGRLGGPTTMRGLGSPGLSTTRGMAGRATFRAASASIRSRLCSWSTRKDMS